MQPAEERGRAGLRLLLREFTFNKDKEKQAALAGPVGVWFESSREGGSRFKVEPGKWAGPGGAITFAGTGKWPEIVSFQLAAERVDLRSFHDFIQLPEFSVLDAEAKAGWTNGPVALAFRLAGEATGPDRDPITVVFKADAQSKGITVEQLEFKNKEEPVLVIAGAVPVRLLPPGTRGWEWLPQGQFDLKGGGRPNPAFWHRVQDLTGIYLESPELDLAVSGPAQRPKASLKAHVPTVLLDLPLWKEQIPTLTDFHLEAGVETNQLAFNLTLRLEGEEVRAVGGLPIPARLWKADQGILKSFWTNIDAHLEIADARIAPFARLAPAYLRPQGSFNLDLQVAPKRQVSGHLAVDDAATLPLQSVGSVQEIRGRLEFNGQGVRIESLTGSIGGEPAAVSGELDWGNAPMLTRLKVRGSNLPLSRESGLILRSDVNLQITNAPGQLPQVTGDLTLRDSLFLAELKPLPRGEVSHPETRFPFVSLDQEPFAEWGLGLKIHGDHFLQIRTPFFHGVASLDGRLQGTLREPMAIGDVKINSGLIQFPFANLRVDQGLVTASVDHPYRPELLVTASSRTFGYNLKLEVKGFADEPVFEFSSNPPLTSGEILMMVSAGELPRQDHNFSTRQRAGNLAFFLGKNLLSRLSSTDREEERLTLRSGEDFSEQGKVTYYLEYKLDEKWSLVGEYDQFNALNAGVKWRLYSR